MVCYGCTIINWGRCVLRCLAPTMAQIVAPTVTPTKEIFTVKHTLAARVGRFSAATLISRVLGYLRDASVAYVFGGGALTDSFYTAFRVSNLLRRLFGEGAMASSFVPIFSESIKTKSKEESQEFLNSMFSSLVSILLIVTVLGIIFAPFLMRLVAPGFAHDPVQFARTVNLTRWTFPFFLFICLAALLGSVLNSFKHFFVSAVAPAMLSVSEIFYLFALLPLLLVCVPGFDAEYQMLGLAISAVLGGAGHFFVQVPQVYSSGYQLGWSWKWKHPDSLRVLSLMIPALIGSSADQINAFVDTICATTLATGSVTALYNSNRLMQFPLALFGVAISSVSLTTLSDFRAEKNYEQCAITLNQSLRLIIFTVLPASIGLILLSHPICALLFEHGKFNNAATILTAQSLAAYAFGLIAYSAVKSLANGFYAFQEPKVPVQIAGVCMVINIVLILLLRKPMGAAGLALATAIAAWVNALWLFLIFRRKLRLLGTPAIEDAGNISLTKTIAKTALSGAAMAIYLRWITLQHWPISITVITGVLGGIIIFTITAHFLKLPEIQSIKNILTRLKTKNYAN